MAEGGLGGVGQLTSRFVFLFFLNILVTVNFPPALDFCAVYFLKLSLRHIYPLILALPCRWVYVKPLFTLSGCNDFLNRLITCRRAGRAPLYGFGRSLYILN